MDGRVPSVWLARLIADGSEYDVQDQEQDGIERLADCGSSTERVRQRPNVICRNTARPSDVRSGFGKQQANEWHISHPGDDDRKAETRHKYCYALK